METANHQKALIYYKKEISENPMNRKKVLVRNVQLKFKMRSQ